MDAESLFFMFQPGPRDGTIQCFIKRDKSNLTYHLFLCLSPGIHYFLYMSLESVSERTVFELEWLICWDYLINTLCGAVPNLLKCYQLRVRRTFSCKCLSVSLLVLVLVNFKVINEFLAMMMLYRGAGVKEKVHELNVLMHLHGFFNCTRGIAHRMINWIVKMIVNWIHAPILNLCCLQHKILTSVAIFFSAASWKWKVPSLCKKNSSNYLHRVCYFYGCR